MKTKQDHSMNPKSTRHWMYQLYIESKSKLDYVTVYWRFERKDDMMRAWWTIEELLHQPKDTKIMYPKNRVRSKSII